MTRFETTLPVEFDLPSSALCDALWAKVARQGGLAELREQGTVYVHRSQHDVFTFTPATVNDVVRRLFHVVGPMLQEVLGALCKVDWTTTKTVRANMLDVCAGLEIFQLTVKPASDAFQLELYRFDGCVVQNDTESTNE